MTKPCPSCGAETHPGARYCRRCGTPLRASTGDGDGTGEVSPQAATVPLNGEARTTDGLGNDESRFPSADTARVNRADLDQLLRTQQISMPPHVNLEGADSSEGAATLIRAEQSALAGEFARFQSSLAREDEEDPQDTSEIEPTASAHGDGIHNTDGDFGMKTRASFVNEPDEELTAVSPRPLRPHGEGAHAEHGEHGEHTHSGSGAISLEIVDGAEAPMPSSSPNPSSPAAVARGPQGRRRLWPFVVAACVAALAVTVAAAWLAALYLRRPAPATDASTQAPTDVPPDAGRLFEEKFAEAEALIASGQMDEAMARLREANTIDPANTRAHRRLGELLSASGARRDAIEEFRAVTRNDPNDFTAWRLLATAEFAEGLHQEAAESYRRLLALVGEGAADPTDLLSYADALARSGSTEEARAVYQRLTSAPVAEIASAARQRLSELASQPAPSPTPGQKNSESARTNHDNADETAANAPPANTVPAPSPTPTAQPTPTPAPTRPPASTPAEHYRRGVELWSSNRSAALSEFRAAGNNPEAHYYLGLSLVEGRDLRSLKRAEIVAALQYFQSAQRSGQFGEQARRQAQQLGREFDRLQKQ
jgi:tetratricopeptide (TPR) repeat protein